MPPPEPLAFSLTSCGPLPDMCIARAVFALVSPGLCLSDRRPVGTRDPSFQVSTDRTCCRVVAPVDVLTVPNELGLEGRSRVRPIARRRRSVALAHLPRANQPGVLPGEDLLGDAPECILGMCDNVAVARGLPGAVLRLRYRVVDHFSRGRARGEGLNRSRRLRAPGEQSAGRCDDKGGANHVTQFASLGPIALAEP